MSADFLILGEGYTGTTLRKLLVKTYPQSKIHSTKRQNTKIIFDLEKEDSWKNLPTAKNIFWTFHAKDKEKAKKLFRLHFRNARVVVISTTSHFLAGDDVEVTETTPIDLSLPRVQAEEALREEGATILHAAGIYGPNRNPLDWYQQGRITDLNKYLNLIHVDDLSQALILAAKNGGKSQRFIAADGQPKLWSEIVRRWFKPEMQDSEEPRTGKQINSRHSLTTLGLHLKYSDMHQGIEALQRLKRE